MTYEEMYIEYYTNYNPLDDYIINNNHKSRETFNKENKILVNLIKKYGDCLHVSIYYKNYGYDGSLDYKLINTPFEVYLTYPQVYFQAPPSLKNWRINNIGLKPTVHEEIDIIKWTHNNKKKLNELCPSVENGVIVIKAPNIILGQSKMFILKDENVVYDYVNDKCGIVNES